MTNEEILNKAVITTDALAAGGLLLPEQADKFINFVVDQSVMAKDARIIRMKARKREIDKIGLGTRVSRPKVEGVAPSERYSPNFGKVELDTKGIITPFEITYESIEENIENGNFEDLIIQSMAKQVATDQEELYIQGDTGVIGDSFLALQNGWIKRSLSGGHVIDWDFDTVEFGLFSRMLKALPAKYKRVYSNLRFYTSHDIAQDYYDLLVKRETAIADQLLIFGGNLQFNGIPVVAAPLIPMKQTEEATPKTYSYILLTSKDNLLVGIKGNEIRLDKDKDIFKGSNLYALTSYICSQYEEVDATVIATNVGTVA